MAGQGESAARGRFAAVGNDSFKRGDHGRHDVPEAKLTITVPERTWPGAVTRTHPAARVRILAAVSESDVGVGLAEIVAAELDPLLADVREHPSIESTKVLQRTDGECLVQFRTTLPLLLMVASGSGLPLEMPFEIADGEATWTLTTSQETLSALGTQLSAMSVPYSLEHVQGDVSRATDLLTDRQQSLLAEAITRGYYDTPRRCSLTELADAVGVAKSTASETLHRAEERVMKEFASTLFDDVPSSVAAAR